MFGGKYKEAENLRLFANVQLLDSNSRVAKASVFSRERYN